MFQVHRHLLFKYASVFPALTNFSRIIKLVKSSTLRYTKFIVQKVFILFKESNNYRFIMHIMYIVQNNCNRADTLIFSYEHNVSLLHITIVVLLCFSVQQSNSINKFSINVIGELSATKWISSFANENPISSFPLWDKIFQYNNGVKTKRRMQVLAK